ncbi:MAG: hypothetical protein IPI67_28745 [Myxococcales bacterium]|nr:hypothetical protein [Myxococcales bacterium]
MPAPGAAPTGTSSAAPNAGGLDRDQPRAEDENQFTSLAEAEAALDRARAELGPATPPTPGARAKTSETANKKPAKPAPSGGEAEPLAAGTDRCVSACKAFASLKRAGSAVCRLAGETNERCKRARGIVQESETKVAVCKCAPDGE